MEIVEFERLLRQMGEELYRDMPWRQDTRPYYVLVSELMLQQTQVDRVIPKFNKFIAAYPDEKSLARASLADILIQWQGLGYNRRAKYLYESAKLLRNMHEFPSDEAALTKLPGVGKNTAGAILAYAFNKPSTFIETNIRAVYIHHFFSESDIVDDNEIIDLMSKSEFLQLEPRNYYWSLMDYGSYLKKQGVKPNRSAQYKKQAPLKGSVREVRGQIVKSLTAGGKSVVELKEMIYEDERFAKALEGLMKDGLVVRIGNKYHLTK